MIWNIIEALALIGSLAAWLVTLAKLDEQKKLTQEEREKRWDEISCAATIEKEKGKEIEELEREIDNLKWDNDCLTMTVDRQQDKLSAILCPTNNHVWKDGVCVKCGRVQEVVESGSKQIVHTVNYFIRFLRRVPVETSSSAKIVYSQSAKQDRRSDDAEIH